MNIVVTGSLGNVSKPLAQELVQKGHSVTVISSKAERQSEIEAMGATAAVGTMEDAEFLTATFKGADIVYVMEALSPTAFFEQNLDMIAAVTAIGSAYKQAIEQSGVKQVVHLSSVGAHTNKGTGLLKMHYNVEQILAELPLDVAIKTIRPVGFYTVMFGFIQAIKAANAIFANYGGDGKEPWVSPLDIAAVIAAEMEKPFAGREVIYIAGDEVSPNEVATILGEAIGRPDLRWVVLPEEMFTSSLLAIGMNPKTARGLVEMNKSRFEGEMYADYNRNKPVLSGIKLKDFAPEFAAAYNA